MIDTEKDILAWADAMRSYHLPRWEELPDLALYLDQVITLIERYLSPLVGHSDAKVITPAMINNYVKLQMMPKPNKKRYERIHMAHLIGITILKQVLLIQQVKDGILLQAEISGYAGAYDLFCQEQEQALQAMAAKLRQEPLESRAVAPEHLGMHLACLSFAGKIFTEQIVSQRMASYKNTNATR